MSSASLGKNAFYNNLQVNRLQVTSLKALESNESQSTDSQKSDLFSLNLQNAHWNGKDLLTFDNRGLT